MNILKALKSINPFSKKKGVKKNTYKDACELLSDLAISAKEKNKPIPEELSKEEWHNILSQIRFGLQSKIKNAEPKSPIRKEQFQHKTKKAFQLLEKYINRL